MVATGLLGLLAALALGTLSAQHRAAEAVAARAELLETGRIAEVVLGEELRAGVWGRDQLGPAGDSLRVRAFRGLGLVCSGPGPDSTLRVRYSGLRAPDPAKDSLLLLGADLRWWVAALKARAPDAERCGSVGADSVERWALDRPAGDAILARIFESGVYSLQGGALRYRRGAGGRQPLTPELLADDGSELVAATPVGVRLRLHVRRPHREGRGRESEVTFWPREWLPP
ncbi:MAG: hypothetical protein HY704_17180 [Gemmatimonadetes bacterium]|nr:hypothetical protein [Gemmatimonadota bacterium]